MSKNVLTYNPSSVYVGLSVNSNDHLKGAVVKRAFERALWVESELSCTACVSKLMQKQLR